MKSGINCYSSTGTFEALGINSHRAKAVKSKELFTVGTLQILPFDTQHDCADPLGFLIYSTLTGEKLLFATDTYYVKYRFSGLTHLMIECNWSEKTLDPDCAYLPRLRKSHFSLENVIEFLNANDLSRVEEIHLLHLSENNSDADFFKEEIQKLTGKIVYIAGE
jgi:phosphoribosyl 1,2-cyclic phosphodiesterase